MDKGELKIEKNFKSKVSEFDGGVLGYIGISIVAFLMILFTIGIATPWAICYVQKWIANHTYLDGQQMIFDGTGGELFGKFIIWILLTIITFGIYCLWIPVRQQQWITEHTHLA